MINKSTTASCYWNSKWESGEDRQSWSQVQEEVFSLLPLLAEHGVSRVLDLGAGIGRHALFFARLGYQTWAVDSSPAALKIIRTEAENLQVSVNTEQVDILSLPFDDSCFDYVLSWNVLYHGDLPALRKAVAEVKRVLQSGGVFQGTFLSKNNFYFGQGEQLDSNTYVCDDKSDKSHPHCYLDYNEVHELLAGFEIKDLVETDFKSYQDAFHYHVVATLR